MLNNKLLRTFHNPPTDMDLLIVDEEIKRWWLSRAGRRAWRAICKDVEGLNMVEFCEYCNG
jgi:hypothetical protein